MKKLLTIFLTFTCLLSYAGEDDKFDFLWLDPDKKVYVLQNKTYKKNKMFYADVGFLMGLGNEFVDTTGYFLKGGYYFHEEWGFELGYKRYSNTTNSSYEAVQYINGIIPFVRKIDSSMYAMAIWSPFYGKVNTFNKIFYFHWNFGLGVGKINANSNLNSVTNPSSENTFDSESYNTINLKTSVKFQINRRTHIGLEFFNTNYNAKIPEKGIPKKWKNQNDIMLEVGFTF